MAETDNALDQLSQVADALKALTPQGPTLVEPDADDDEANPKELVEFVRTGLVRVWVQGKRYRLRRPFFGELRDLRTALEGMMDEVSQASIEATTKGDDLKRQSSEITDDDPDRNRKIVELRQADRKVAREFDAKIEDMRVDWWRQVFDRVSVDGAPDEWPAWVSDANLPAQVITHWRSVPLGRG